MKASRHLLLLLEHDEITYDLLWALFTPKSMAYTTCFGTGKPRCVIYDTGEEQETSSGLKYYKMECRYLDYDGQVFGKASINPAIVKFREKRRISTLNAFPLRYHPDEQGLKAQLVKCGQNIRLHARSLPSSLPRYGILHEGRRACQGFCRQPGYA